MNMNSAPLKGMDLPLKQNIPSHNPIQLAAISNYKLAQLTFAPPDLHSLRKTAVIKNMIQNVYTSTPPEWLQQMTRWQYFTPESLEEMTQEGLEEIFNQYAQTIEAFRPIKQAVYHYEDELFDDEDDGQGDDLWIAEDEIDSTNTSAILPPTSPIPAPTPLLQQQQQQQGTNNLDSIFSQPNATLSNESIEFPIRSPSPLSEKPLPANPFLNDDTAKQARRKSGFAGGNKNRLSWTSDTGITSSVVSQNLANEIMSLFDMDFAVDIKVDTAPKLPELPFIKRKAARTSQHRQSQDMLTSLIPAFEKIALENSTEFFDQISIVQPSPPPTPQHQYQQQQRPRPNLVITSVPKRSSSLRHRQESGMSSPITPPATPDSPVDKSLAKKKSLLRIASLIHSKKQPSKEMLPNSPEPSPIQQQNTDTSYFEPTTTAISNTPRKTSTSTVDSITSSSSSWSYVSDEFNTKAFPRPQKPLPETPNSPDFIPTTTRDDYISGDELNQNNNSKKHRARRSTKKKRKSIMEKTMSKRKSNHGLQSIYDASNVTVPPVAAVLSEEQQQKGLSRSKSAFIKIGNGLKTKKQLKQIRRTSSAKNLTTDTTSNSPYQFQYHTTNDVDQLHNIQQQEQQPSSEESLRQHTSNNNSFVKRMASFNWRIKPRHKPVAV